MTRTRVCLDDRDGAILAAARRIIETKGLSALTRRAIAAEAGISPATVSNFGVVEFASGGPPSEGYRKRIMRALYPDPRVIPGYLKGITE